MSRIVSDITFRTRIEGPSQTNFDLLSNALSATWHVGGDPTSAVRGRDLENERGIFAVVTVRAVWLSGPIEDEATPTLLNEEQADTYLESLFRNLGVNAESLTSFSQSTFDPDPAAAPFATIGPPPVLPAEPGPRSGFDAS